jgi:hypothetical protein
VKSPCPEALPEPGSRILEHVSTKWIAAFSGDLHGVGDTVGSTVIGPNPLELVAMDIQVASTMDTEHLRQ